MDRKVAEYLCALNLDACSRFCSIKNINMTEVLPFDFKTADEVFNCLSSFMEVGVPLRYLFDNPNVWGIYMHSIVGERYAKGLNLVLCSKNPANLILYFRACYRFGFPAIDDASFDVLEKLYIQEYPALRFLEEQTYDDDEYNPIVTDAIKMSGVRSSGKKVSETISITDLSETSEYADLNADKSKSVRPVISVDEAFDFWSKAPNCRVNFSLKIDGINTKMLFSQENNIGLNLALSRGRATNSIDYTNAVRNMFQVKNINDKLLNGKVTGESFVSLEDLKVLNSRYPDKEYKTPKSAAMAMLRSPDNFLVEDYNLLSFLAFDYNDGRPDVTFKQLKEAGLEVPPNLEFDGEQIPKNDIKEFSNWMDLNVLKPLYDKGQKLGIGSDGVVMYLLADINTERRDKYSDSTIAIKYSYWSAASYLSKVVDIIFEQKRVEASIVLVVEPVVMRDSNTATRVGIGSPDILIKDGVKKGDTIEFERKSEAYNVYLRKVNV